MNRSLHATTVRALTAARFRIVLAVDFDDVPVGVLHAVLARHKIRVSQANFATGREAIILFGRVFHEVVAFDIKRLGERNLARSVRFILGIVDRDKHFRLIFGIVVDHELNRIEDAHTTERSLIEILARAIFQNDRVDHAVEFRNPDRLAEETQRLGGVPAAAKTADRRHARIVPTVDVILFDEFEEFAFAHHRVGKVETRKFDLLRMVRSKFVQEPVVEGTVLFELKRADRMCNSLYRVFEPVRPVVHWVDIPLIPLAVMRRADDSIHDRIAHIKVRRRHVDLRAERLGTVREFAVLHAFEEVEIFLDGTIAPRALLTRFGRRAARLADLIRSKVANVSFSLLDELDRIFVHLFEVVGREEKPIAPIGAKPLHVFFDRLDVFNVFFRGVRVVKAKIEEAAEFLRHTGVENNRLRVPDMKIPVRLGGETRMDALFETTSLIVVFDDLFDEMQRTRGSVLRSSFFIKI